VFDPIISGVPWAIAGGVASVPGTQPNATDLRQGNVPAARGKRFVARVNVVTCNAFGIRLFGITSSWSHGSGGISVFSPGVRAYLLRYIGTSTAVLVGFRAGDNAVASIDDVELRELF